MRKKSCPRHPGRLKEKLEGMVLEGLVDEKSRILFVDDGSRDKTWEIISRLHQEDPRFLGLKLSRNKGHQNALLAGLMTAKELCDMAISLDADLQDDVDAIDRFVLEYQNGCDIVYGVRSKRETDTWFKRTTAEGFYKVMQALGVDIVDNHADYRLMSRRALEGLAQFREVNLFLRGIVPLIGYKSAVVTYERSERFAGESKYPLKKMLSFAFDGITSFSVKPISFILGLGVLMTGISGLALLVLLVLWLLGWGVSGFGVLCGSLWLLGGIQLMALGMVGEYVGKIYKEVKARPKYIIETFLKDQEERG